MPDGARYDIKIAVDEGYLFTVGQRVTNASGKPLAIRPIGLVSRAIKSHDPDSWTNHVGPISVFGGKADYDIDYKTLDEGTQSGVRQCQRLARLHRQILADRAGAGQCRDERRFPRESRAAATRPITRSLRRSSRPARR